MNRFFTGIVVLLSVWLFALTLKAASPEVEQARQHGAQGQVTFRVIDSTGRPVEKANVRATFFESDSYGYINFARGQTDTNGLFIASGKTIYDVTFDVKKDGFYSTEGQYQFYRRGEDCVQNGRWQPWNPTNTVVLKEHRNPVAMCAKEVDIRIPVRDQAIGFDLEKGDWVAPHGQGTMADLLINFTATYEGPQAFSKRIELSVSNPRDGVQAFALDRTSELMSLYAAPEEGYAPKLVDEQVRTRTKILKSSEIGKGQYLVFRVRSVTNEEGGIVSANYGKIYGPNLLDPIIEYGRMRDTDRLMFTYYLNPTPNDRNLEFDPSRNLFKDLKSTERVTDP